jgi:hypothetical protein
MPRKPYSTEQIVTKLRQVQRGCCPRLNHTAFGGGRSYSADTDSQAFGHCQPWLNGSGLDPF